jgi:hypothetical protein
MAVERVKRERAWEVLIGSAENKRFEKVSTTLGLI